MADSTAEADNAQGVLPQENQQGSLSDTLTYASEDDLQEVSVQQIEPEFLQTAKDDAEISSRGLMTNFDLPSAEWQDPKLSNREREDQDVSTTPWNDLGGFNSGPRNPDALNIGGNSSNFSHTGWNDHQTSTAPGDGLRGFTSRQTNPESAFGETTRGFSGVDAEVKAAWFGALDSSAVRRNPDVSRAGRSGPRGAGQGGDLDAQILVTRGMAAGSRPRPVVTRTTPGSTGGRSVIRAVPDPRRGRILLVRGTVGHRGGLIIRTAQSGSDNGPPIVTRDLPVSDTEPMIRTTSTARISCRVQQRKCTWLKMRLVLLAITLVIGLIVGIAVGTKKSSDDGTSDTDFSQTPVLESPQGDQMKGAEFHCYFDFDNYWHDEMADAQSSSFKSWATRLENLINDIYSYSPLEERFDHSIVIKLSMHTSYMIWVSSLLKLKGYTLDLGDSPLVAADLKAAFLRGYRRMLDSDAVSYSSKQFAVKIITDSLVVSSGIVTTTTTTTTTTAPPWMPRRTTAYPWVPRRTTAYPWVPRRTTAYPWVPRRTTSRPAPFTTVAPTESECGEVRVLPEVRIVGGAETGKGVYPWMVMLIEDTPTKSGAFFCGGSILDRWHIITAGHCLKDKPRNEWTGIVNTRQNRITVIAGKHESNTTIRYSQEQRVAARSGYLHKSFVMSMRAENDIALIRLERPLQFNSRVKPICLPSSSERLPPVCVIAGWGSLDYENEDLPTTLRSATLRSYNRSECLRTFSPKFTFEGHSLSFFLVPGVMCAANTTFGGQDTCQGDSGGPLFCLKSGASGEKRYTQFGVVSWGVGCGNPGEPGFYTFLPHFVSWIHGTALPALNEDISSSEDTDSDECNTVSVMTDYRFYNCRSAFLRFTMNTQCQGLSEVVSCAVRVLVANDHHCTENTVTTAILNSADVTATKRLRCQANTPSRPESFDGAVCTNHTAVSSAVDLCTQGLECTSMLEVTLCVHSLVDPEWLHCTRQQLDDFISAHFNDSITICSDYTVRTMTDGRQFMYIRSDWHVLCGDHWGQQEVSIACTQRGFRTGKPSFIHRTDDNVYVADRANPLVAGIHHSIKASGWMRVTCSGYETSLAQCDLVRQTTCSSGYLAASVCYNTAYNFTLYALSEEHDYGYIRLTRDEGEGYVCSTDLSDTAAHQLCREAGYEAGMPYPYPLTSFPDSAVWKTEMRCSTGAVDVNGCAHGKWTFLPQASGSCHLAKVFCFASKTRLHNGLFNTTGIVQMYRPAPNGHDVTLKTVCREGFDDVSAARLCRQLGFSGGGHALAFNPFYRPRTQYVQVDCSGLEEHLEDCALRDGSIEMCRAPAAVQCVSPSSHEEELSLKLSEVDSEVQVYLDGQWGTVCTDHWTDNEATTICRQLGHLHGYRRFKKFEADPRRNVPHVLHDLRCGVNVTSLQQCSYQRVKSDVCQHTRAAAVRCSNDSRPVYSFQDTFNAPGNEGTVYVNYNGTAAPLLAQLSNLTANALCRAMGYVTGEPKRSYTRHHGLVWLASYLSDCSDVEECLQPYPELINCSSSPGSYGFQDGRCYTSAASVSCYASAARVHTGALQTTGIVQVYRKGRWWEICHDDLTQTAADVICRDIMRSPSASAILLRNVYRLGIYQTVKASVFCDPEDLAMTSSECLVPHLSSTCESFNNDPASVVCYDGQKPSGAISDWKIDSEFRSRVWVKRYGVWGTVCDDKWLDEEARLLCEHEGYSGGSYDKKPFKHDATTALWAWSVDCSIFASALSECRVNLTSVVTGACRSNHDATVNCNEYSYY